MRAHRHELVFVDPDCEFSLHSCRSGENLFYGQVRAWFARGLPCIFARQSSSASKAELNLGLLLVYADKKQRISLQLGEDAVLRYQPLPRLSEMASFFAEHYGVSTSQFDFISIYGSFLFHYLSGQPYVDENSDLDLLIDYSDYCKRNKLTENSSALPQGQVAGIGDFGLERDFSLNSLANLVQRLAKIFNRSIDGEIRFADFGDVAIKELVDLSDRQILVKQRDRVELIQRTVLYERYPSLQAD